MNMPWLEEYQKLLSQQYKNQHLPHAILITGVAASGKSALAKWLTKLIICDSPALSNDNQILSACGHCKSCLLAKNHSYPDHYALETDSRTIGVDDVRNANKFLEKTAMLGTFKTVMIAQAEKMSVSAANALLKTLEEPTNHSVIVLSTNDSEHLLPTVVSRCRVFNIRPAVGNHLLSDTQTASIEKISKSAFANLSQLPELSDEVVAQQFNMVEQLFIEYISHNAGYTKLLSALSDSPFATRWLEKIIVNLARTRQGWLMSTNKLELSSISDDNSEDRLWSIYQAIISYSRLTKSLSQVNEQMLLEKLLIDIRTLMTKRGE